MSGTARDIEQVANASNPASPSLVAEQLAAGLTAALKWLMRAIYRPNDEQNPA
jgi:hypothetical protein